MYPSWPSRFTVFRHPGDIDEVSISFWKDCPTPLTTETMPTAMTSSPATTTMTCPPGNPRTPEVALPSDRELDDPETSAIFVELAPSARNTSALDALVAFSRTLAAPSLSRYPQIATLVCQS